MPVSIGPVWIVFCIWYVKKSANDVAVPLYSPLNLHMTN